MSGSNSGPAFMSQSEADERAQVERIQADIASGRFTPREALYREQRYDNDEVVRLTAGEPEKGTETPAAEPPTRGLAFFEDKPPARYADLKAEHASAQDVEEPAQPEKDQSAGSRTLTFHENRYQDQEQGLSH